MTLSAFREKLVDKILCAPTQDHAGRLVDAALKALHKHRVNGHLVARFIEKTTRQLAEHASAHPDSQQAANISVARLRFRDR